MCNDRFYILLTRKLSGEATLTELKELDILIANLPEKHNTFDKIAGIWNTSPAQDEDFMEATYLAHLERMKDKGIPLHQDDVAANPGLNEAAQNKFSLKKIAFAVIMALVVACGGWFILKNETAKENAPTFSEIKTPKGARSKVTLPDGSNVWLNAGSKLTYSKDFGKEIREVELNGEGYFDVVKMKSKPFIIHTSNMNIKVLGTVFNVKAYPEDKQSETSLLSGSIVVTIKNRLDSKIVLSPNEKLIVENETIVTGEKIQSTKEAALPSFSIQALKAGSANGIIEEAQWVYNKLVFNDESLKEVALKMQRWYNVSIEIKEESLAQKRFTGNFEKETINQALSALKMITYFEFKQTGEKITIYN